MINNDYRLEKLHDFGWSKIQLSKEADIFNLSGFYVAPSNVGPELKLKCDGLEILTETHKIEKLKLLGNHSSDVFHLSAKGIASKPQKTIRIGFESLDGKNNSSTAHDWFWVQNPSRAIPPIKLMEYIGAHNVDWFHFAGGTWAEKSLLLWEDITRKNRSEIDSIVDWGCGCARVSRHYFDICDAKITGLDIDSKTIEWCNNNLPAGRWHTIEADPQCVLADNSIDLLIGHSVFTHLNEKDQFKWLKELNRMIQPGGIVMVTILGDYSVFLEPLPPEDDQHLQENGILQSTHDKNKSYPSYHKGVYHTHEYINKKWSKYFKVLDIIEGFADHQALVLLQKSV